MTAIPLNRGNLKQIAGSIRIPAYDPAAITPGIVHLGLGGFPSRAHGPLHARADGAQAGMRDWGIIGAGILSADAGCATAPAHRTGSTRWSNAAGGGARRNYRLGRARDLRGRSSADCWMRSTARDPHRQPDGDRERLLPEPRNEAARLRARAHTADWQTRAAEKRDRHHRRGLPAATAGRRRHSLR